MVVVGEIYVPLGVLWTAQGGACAIRVFDRLFFVFSAEKRKIVARSDKNSIIFVHLGIPLYFFYGLFFTFAIHFKQSALCYIYKTSLNYPFLFRLMIWCIMIMAASIVALFTVVRIRRIIDSISLVLLLICVCSYLVGLSLLSKSLALGAYGLMDVTSF